MNRQATSRAAQMKKADARANRNTKAPMQSNNTAKLQEALWDAGFYKGMKDRKGRELTFEQAVDGIKGNMTKAAINKAQESGYFVKNDGSLGKYADIDPKVEYTPQKVGKRATKEELQKATKEAISRGVSADVPTISIKNSQGDSNIGDSPNIYPRKSFGPISQYVKDLIHRNFIAKEGDPDIQITNRDFSTSYNQDASRLAQIAYRQYVREHGYPKSGQQFSLPINPSVYKEINKDGKYANFTMSNIIKAAFGGDNQVEFTDGGMSGKAIINPETGKLDVTFTDRTAWDLTNQEKEKFKTKGGLGNQVRLFMSSYGSSGNDNLPDYVQKLQYSIPSDTISGNYKGRLRDIPYYINR